MAELLVRVTDKINADFYLNCQCRKRGDVITVQEDGWPWGTIELTHPEWRLLQIPGISVSDASVFLAPEFDRDPGHPSRTLQRCAVRLDLDALMADPSMAQYLKDNTRSVDRSALSEKVAIVDQLAKTALSDQAASDPRINPNDPALLMKQREVIAKTVGVQAYVVNDATPIHSSTVVKSSIADPAIIGEIAGVIG